MTFEGPNGVEVVPIRPRLVSNSVQFQQDCICAGNGIAVVSRTQAEAELARGNLVEILPEYHVSPLWLRALVPADRLKLRRVQILLVFLKSASPG
jgi:DNA-binding transcriptional LysR family regulator